ncbi:hypothetical protein BX666DRAFT_1910539, partial [Dichotomocladium elegans]
MNPQNPNLANGQQSAPQALNLGMQNIPNANWRDELTPGDRNSFVTQLFDALRRLSPTTPQSDIYTAAKNFENTLYTNSINKNQYILAYAKKIHHIRSSLREQPIINQKAASGAAATGPPNMG